MKKFVLGYWNRIIFEIVQSQPQEIGAGFSAARIWVNQTATSRVYFGNFATGDRTIPDGNQSAIDVCGAYDSASSNLVSSSLTGNFDILNLLWIQGSQGLFQNMTGNNQATLILLENKLMFLDTICLLQAFIEPSQASCVLCASGYKLQDNQKCVLSASNSSYFLHAPTSSYQRII